MWKTTLEITPDLLVGPLKRTILHTVTLSIYGTIPQIECLAMLDSVFLHIFLFLSFENNSLIGGYIHFIMCEG